MSDTTKKLEDYKAPYPKPTEDQKRYVIFLEEKPDELTNYKVQLIPGRTVKLDTANSYFIAGNVKEENIPGWQYPYYVVELGEMGGTLIGMDPSAPPVERFVPMANSPFIRYNSRLPVVVYLPKDAELHYRIWTPTNLVAESGKEA